MTRPVLMTGASGFVGRAVAARLVAAGATVVSLGRSVPALHGVRHLDADIGDAIEARAVVDRLRPRAVLALASAPPPAADDIHETVTLGAALALLAAAQTVEGCRFVGIGSAAEYGSAETDAPLGEDALRLPASAYGRAKAQLMDMIAEAASSGGDAVGLRLFAAIGPDMPTHSLLGSVVRQLRAPDRTVVRTGALDGWRDYLPVAAVARLTVALALAPTRPPAWINVGSGRATALRELVAATLRFSGRAVEFREAERPETARGRCIVADVTRLKSLGHAVDPLPVADLAVLALGMAAGDDDHAGSEALRPS
ncbi:NAD(P)-dependent oxidoreductase [Aquibium sp. ELW1220]|uniref:NAD-dependent epimerase/dehydratase family protein n=1 Tax=Aquibium sp. ELW1220 TaxID=2976766 RepID=UPI0025B238DE|nr:NAD(P)-dependent oxidoreductase [Aquibium sp. ELW1220]MDN2583420.1 NAD(P)-dependent oxidoreductase [Aquibium sp. ELW1220]